MSTSAKRLTTHRSCASPPSRIPFFGDDGRRLGLKYFFRTSRSRTPLQFSNVADLSEDVPVPTPVASHADDAAPTPIDVDAEHPRFAVAESFEV